MSYNTVAIMADDAGLISRIIACGAVEQKADPEWWGRKYRWNVVSAPGWSAKWESAVAGNVEDPGRNEAVISDGDILSSVQYVLGDMVGQPTFA